MSISLVTPSNESSGPVDEVEQLRKEIKIAVVTPTHDTRYLMETFESLKLQTYRNWEWFIMVNHPSGAPVELERLRIEVSLIVEHFDGPKIHLFADAMALAPGQGVGLRKSAAFRAAIEAVNPDVLVELDHDDLLVPSALEKVAKAFRDDPEVDFVYSDAAYFEPEGKPQGTPSYMRPQVRREWEKNGFEFYEANIEGFRPGKYVCVRAFEPSPVSFSTVFWAPDHVRAWRRDFYQSVGGYNPAMEFCDDHELLCKTYVEGRKLVHLSEPLYLYRHSTTNTWESKAQRIRELTYQVENRFIVPMAVRDAKRRGLKVLVLGDDPEVLKNDNPQRIVGADVWNDGGLTRFTPESSVGLVHAHDVIGQIKDPMNFMRDVYRVLAPGGILHVRTPSTDGRGAFQDPRNVSFWNQNSFWYWTREAQRSFLPEAYQHVRFQVIVLDTWYPSEWHKQNMIPYVDAHLVALKDGWVGPGMDVT